MLLRLCIEIVGSTLSDVLDLKCDLGAASPVISWFSANTLLSEAIFFLTSFWIRLQIRYAISQMHIKIQAAEETTMKRVKIFFSVGRDM